MAGNRNRQSAFQIPVLLELASKFGSVDTQKDGRRRSEDVSDLLKDVLSYFDFTDAERSVRHKRSNELVLENDVLFAVDQLEELQQLKRIKRQKWVILPAGTKRLRDYLSQVLRKKSHHHAAHKVAMWIPEDREELVLIATKLIASTDGPSATLETLVLSSASLSHLFQNAVRNIPIGVFGSFASSGYEAIKGLLSREIASTHGLRSKLVAH